MRRRDRFDLLPPPRATGTGRRRIRRRGAHRWTLVAQDSTI